MQTNNDKNKRINFILKYITGIKIENYNIKFYITCGEYRTYYICDKSNLGIKRVISIDTIYNILISNGKNRKHKINKYLINIIDDFCINKYLKYNEDYFIEIYKSKRLHVKHFYNYERTSWEIQIDFSNYKQSKYTICKLCYDTISCNLSLEIEGNKINGVYVGSDLEMIVFVNYLIDNIYKRYCKIYK